MLYMYILVENEVEAGTEPIECGRNKKIKMKNQRRPRDRALKFEDAQCAMTQCVEDAYCDNAIAIVMPSSVI